MTRLLLPLILFIFAVIGFKLAEHPSHCPAATYRMDYEKHAITHCVDGKWELVK